MDKYISKSKTFGESALSFIVSNRTIIFVLVSAAIIAFMMINIVAKADQAPSTNQIAEAESSIKVIKFNTNNIQVINTLRESNIQIEALFAPGRYDPFNN